MDRRLGNVTFALVFAAIAPLVADETPETEAEQIQGLLKSVSQDAKQRRAKGDAQKAKVEGRIFEAVAKLANGDERAAWNEVIDETDGIVNELAELKAFPCKRDDMISAGHAKGYEVMKQGEGRITERRCIGGNAPQRVQNAMLVHHGDLVVKGIIYDGIVIVTGNLYLHEGYVYDSIVIVQGDFVCGGYINNSVVIAGENITLCLMDSYANKSVIAAGTIKSGSYTSESLYSGEMVSRSSQGVDLRNSRQFDAAPFYKRLGKRSEDGAASRR